MDGVKFENPGKKKLSKPIDNFKRLPMETLENLTNTKKEGGSCKR